MVGILYSIFCELKQRGVQHPYSFSFKRWGENPTSNELLTIVKQLVNQKVLEQGRNPRNEFVYKLGVKGALKCSKLSDLDPLMQNVLMAWIGYYLPMTSSQNDRNLYDKFKLANFEINDSLPLQTTFSFNKKASIEWEDDDDIPF